MNSWPEGEEFTVTITSETEGAPALEKTSATLTKDEPSYEFSFAYSEADIGKTYEYTVKETAGDNSTIT